MPCSAGHTACYVSPYGDVYPCVQFPLPTGNVRTTRFLDIWRHSPGHEANLRRLNIFEVNPETGVRPQVTVEDLDSDNPNKDILVQVKETPTGSLMFGGPGLDQLFVTTIDTTYFGQPADVASGYLYVVEVLGARGLPEPRFRG